MVTATKCDRTVAQSLAPLHTEYGPVYDHDTPTDETLWETWVVGFELAMRLRIDAWDQIVESDDEEAASSISMMIALYQIAEGDSELPQSSIDDLTERAPDLIADIVVTLNHWTKTNMMSAPRPFDTAANSPHAPHHNNKIGRNEPCPSDSGRKYKKCCGGH